MIGEAERERGPWGRWRVAGWGGAAALVLLPWLAMQVTDEVNWSPADFVIAGLLVAGVGAILEAAVRRTDSRCYRAAVAVALAAAFLLVWVNGAVGIIGSEENPANLLYGGVLVVAIAGAVLARGRPAGMAPAMYATALAQMFVAATAAILGWGLPGSGPLEVLALNGSFAVLWLVAARLFRRATRAGTSAESLR
jgi:hypothetical protein